MSFPEINLRKIKFSFFALLCMFIFISPSAFSNPVDLKPIKTIPATALDGSKWKFLVDCDFGEMSYTGPFKVIGKNKILWTRFFEHPNDDMRNQTFKSKGIYIEKDQKLIFKRGGTQPGEIIFQFINKEDATYAKGFFVNHSKCNIEDTNVSQMSEKPKNFLKIAQANQTKILYAATVKEKENLKKIRAILAAKELKLKNISSALSKKTTDLSKKESNLKKKIVLLSNREKKQTEYEKNIQKRIKALNKNESKQKANMQKQKVDIQKRIKALNKTKSEQKANMQKQKQELQQKFTSLNKNMTTFLKNKKETEEKNKLAKKKILLALQTEIKRKISTKKLAKERKANFDKREQKLKTQLSNLKKEKEIFQKLVIKNKNKALDLQKKEQLTEKNLLVLKKRLTTLIKRELKNRAKERSLLEKTKKLKAQENTIATNKNSQLKQQKDSLQKRENALIKRELKNKAKERSLLEKTKKLKAQENTIANNKNSQLKQQKDSLQKRENALIKRELKNKAKERSLLEKTKKLKAQENTIATNKNSQLKQQKDSLQKRENALIKKIATFNKKEKIFKNKMIEHQKKIKTQFRNIAKLRKKVQTKTKSTKEKKIQIAKPKISLKKVGISISKLNIPCRLTVGNNYSYVSFNNFSPENANTLFPKGKKGYGKSDTTKVITLEIKGNNSVRNFQGKVRYAVRQGKVSFPYDRDFPKVNLSRTQMNETFGSSYGIKCFISSTKNKKNASDSPKIQSSKTIGDLEFAELAQKKIKEKKFGEAESYIKKIQDDAIRSLFLKSLADKKNSGNSGMNENIAKDIRFLVVTACKLKKIGDKKGISMEEKNKLMLGMMPKLILMKDAKERIEKYRKSLSGDKSKEFKAAGLKMMAELNLLECMK